MADTSNKRTMPQAAAREDEDAAWPFGSLFEVPTPAHPARSPTAMATLPLLSNPVLPWKKSANRLAN